MHKFKTSQGKALWYDVRTNRISQFDREVEKPACPVVFFRPPTTVTTNKISMFTIEMTQQCNLRCKYCCYSGEYRDRRVHNEHEITFEVLNDAVSFIKKYSDKEADEITVCFYGGEALLAKEKIEWFINKISIEIDQSILFSISTNGLALTESVIDWICGYDNILVNITIDGDKTMHDANRVTLSMCGSYDKIIENLKLFKKKYPEEYDKRIRFLSTVYSWNEVLKLSDIWDNEDAIAYKYPVHISHIIPNFNDESRTYDTWQTKDNFYSKAFEAYKCGDDGILATSFKKLIDIVAHRDYGHLSNVLMVKTCFQELWSTFINVDGDIYACERFCGKAKVGNVLSGFDQKRIIAIVQEFTDRKNKFCSQCWAKRFCRMCLTSLNHTDEEIQKMCDMERDTIDLALKYYCELKDWEYKNNKI